MKAIIRNITYPWIAARDGQGGYGRHLKALLESQYWSRQQIQEYQFTKLKKLLLHAYQSTDFYKERFDECGFHPDKFQDFDDLKKIPRLTKQDFLDHSKKMLSATFNSDQLHLSESGGTTGIVTLFYRDNDSLPPKYAAALRFDTWAGWQPGEWISLIWPATLDNLGKSTTRKKIRNYLSYRKLKLAMMVIEPELIEAHFREIRKYKPKVTRGFVSTVFETAKYILDNDVKDLSIRSVITTGEPLYPHQRQIIEQAFQSPVFDSYRTREVGVVGQECDKHDGFHLNAEQSFLEVIPDDKLNSDDKGRVLLTDLVNYGMPIIRYEIGDVAKLSTGQCQCGRGLPLLKEMGGRLADIFYAPNGKKVAAITLIPMLIFHFGLQNQIQFVQEDFDHLHIRMSKPKPSDKVLEKQKQMVNRIFDAEMKVTHEFVDEIPLLPSGKYPFIVCNIPPEKLKAKAGVYESD